MSGGDGAPDRYEFPQCMHALAAGLHRENINPGKMIITLPFDDWWRLQCAIERKYEHIMTHDGRGALADKFHYMGFTFQWR
jgi:hypothetical protein